MTFKKEQSAGKITYTWISKKQKALQKEAFTPPVWTFLPTIMLSTGNWNSYSAQLNKDFILASKTDTKSCISYKKGAKACASTTKGAYKLEQDCWN